ncbi:hypothetical protein [Kitasatospora sp. GAS204B]|nr:hypothetical protein [Kitasatospora sp. GAS204B]MDH6121081.1 hypothetical protein [Kitasatospora sp. GAS204B]
MPRKRLARRERTALTRAVLSGFVSGTARAVVTWLLDLVHQ